MAFVWGLLFHPLVHAFDHAGHETSLTCEFCQGSASPEISVALTEPQPTEYWTLVESTRSVDTGVRPQPRGRAPPLNG